MAEGTKVGQAWGITYLKINDYLETLHQREIHRAELAVSALEKIVCLKKRVSLPGTAA